MNGVLDGNNDILPAIRPDLGTPFVWYKTTICCFRLQELACHLREDGWNVRPLLVVRDVRSIWSSLAKKPYGKNGLTAEDPPLRLRMRRFKEDWQFFRQMNWPVLRYEDFLQNTEETLRRVCAELELPWFDDMLAWPKAATEIVNARHGNKTFWATRVEGLKNTIRPMSTKPPAVAIPAADLRWLEAEFHEFNEANGYPHHLDGVIGPNDCGPRAVPSFEVTRRYKWELRRKPVRWLMSTLGLQNGPRMRSVSLEE